MELRQVWWLFTDDSEIDQLAHSFIPDIYIAPLKET